MTICPRCKAQNRDGARFCQACGTALEQTVPSPQVAEALETKPLPQKPTAMPEPLPAGQRASDVQTKLLPLPEFASLLPGELLEKRRYAIVSVINKSPKLNAYQVQDRHHLQCPQCGSATS